MLEPPVPTVTLGPSDPNKPTYNGASLRKEGVNIYILTTTFLSEVNYFLLIPLILKNIS